MLVCLSVHLSVCCLCHLLCVHICPFCLCYLYVCLSVCILSVQGVDFRLQNLTALQCVALSICLSVCLSICESVSSRLTSIYLHHLCAMHLSSCLFVYLFVRLSVLYIVPVVYIVCFCLFSVIYDSIYF